MQIKINFLVFDPFDSACDLVGVFGLFFCFPHPPHDAVRTSYPMVCYRDLGEQPALREWWVGCGGDGSMMLGLLSSPCVTSTMQHFATPLLRLM